MLPVQGIGNNKEDEKETMYDEMAFETINTIVGLSISEFPNGEKGVSIKIPVDCSRIDILSFKDDKMQTVEFATKTGNLTVGIIK